MKAFVTMAAVVMTASVLACNEQKAVQQAPPFWTPDEEKEYQACLPQSLKAWKTRKEAEDYCQTDEEHKRWLRNHPEVAGKKEIEHKMDTCLTINAAKINGTQEEFRTAFDGCMSEAYGLQKNVTK